MASDGSPRVYCPVSDIGVLMGNHDLINTNSDANDQALEIHEGVGRRMSASRQQIAVFVLVSAMGLSACAAIGQPGRESTVTLEEAKAEAQATELEIASKIPRAVVVAFDQKPEGTLFSCDDTQHRWKGAATVTLTPGADAESIVKDLEITMANDDRFESSNWIGPTGVYNVQLTSPGTPANFIFSEGEPGTIIFDSSSVCFTLPEGVYPGGRF